MKVWIQIFIGAVAGFLGATLILNNFIFNLTHYADAIVTSILVIIFLLLLLSLVLYRQITKLNHKEVYGDEEDEVDALIYRKFTDYSFLVQSSCILSILALCISLIANQQIVFTVIAGVAIIVSSMLTRFMSKLIQLVYPDRNMPSFAEKNYDDKLLKVSDEGEKHVMLIRLYKSYNLAHLALTIAIVLSTFYSISSGNSQLFSIIVMSIVLLLTHGKYCLSIRNK